MDQVLGSVHVFAPLARAAFPIAGVIAGDSKQANVIDGGAYQVTGDTVNTGTPEAPVGRRVRLHDQPSGRVVAEQWSDPVTGAYNFTHLRQGTYYVMGFDHTGVYDGESETDVVSEPMP